MSSPSSSSSTIDERRRPSPTRAAPGSAQQIRDEQDREYEQHLAIDRERDRQQQRQRESEMQREQARKDRSARLAPEPMMGASNVVSVAIRLPTGRRLLRRFDRSRPLQVSVDCV
jgi:hypothetical protein